MESKFEKLMGGADSKKTTTKKTKNSKKKAKTEREVFNEIYEHIFDYDECLEGGHNMSHYGF